MRKTLDLHIETLSRFFGALNWDDHLIYGDFLAQTYYFVSHSTRLLALAASRFTAVEDHLFKGFVQHLGEENNHEKIILNDLKKLDLLLTEFPEQGLTRGFYEAQYYKIEHQDPTALLGYILILEAVAVRFGPGVLKKVTARFGAQAAHFLKVHIAEDPEPVERALAMIGALKPERIKYITLNLEQSSTTYGMMLKSLGKAETLDRSKTQKLAS